jgi:hypothetical protein
MALYPVGPSSYSELFDITQYVTNAEVADQVNSLIEESRAVFAGGAFLSVNEGTRSRARQTYLRRKWEAYQAGGPWAALAAALFFSTHDESRGNALDFGVTNVDGTNRSLTMSEHAWLVARGRERGIVWTGGDPTFMSPAELWHFNGYPERASIPPLSAAPAIPATFQEEDMIIIRDLDNGTTYAIAHGYVRHLATTAAVNAMKACGYPYKELKYGVVREVFAGHGVPQSMIDVAALKREGGSWSIAERARAAALQA